MQTLPFKARIYLLLIWLAALLTAGWAMSIRLPRSDAQSWEGILFAVLAVVAYGKKIVLVHLSSEEDSVTVSFGCVITFAALLRLGPLGALVIAVAGCLFSCVYPNCQRGFQIAFNVAVAVLATWLAGLTFLYLNTGDLSLYPAHTIPAVAVASVVYFLVNTGAMAVNNSLCTDQKILPLWREDFLWTAPGYFVGAGVGTLAVVACGSGSWLLLVCVTPLAWLTYQASVVTMGRAHDRQKHIESLANLYLGTIRSLALAIDAKDQYNQQHILRVQRYAVALAKQMGLSENLVEAVNTGALLHDIGKLGVPDYVLLKPGRLSEEEFEKIKKHPEIGAAILETVEFPWPVLPVVRSHHEWWNGSGYPDGLEGEAIPLTARVLAVADVYDALTSARAYRTAWTSEAALAELERSAGTQFDPGVVAAFIQIAGDIPVEVVPSGKPVSDAVPGGAIVKAGDAARLIQRASSELWALYEVAQTLSSSLGLQETLEILGGKLEAILPGTACLFLLREAAEDTLIVRVAVGLNSEFFAGARAARLTSLSLAVATHRETYCGGYDAEDLLLTSSQSAQWEPLKAALIVPIVHQGEVLGTINLYHPEPEAFSPHDQQLMETISERAAMALYNGLLFDRTRSHANTDPLTGLFNFRYITQQVDDLCAAADPAADSLALLCLDLDSFKPINDNFGHQKGDQVLRDLADIFREAVRDTDIVARYGGDEFLVALRGASAAEARSMCHRLHAAVLAYDPGLIHEELGALRLGVSIGYGCFPADGSDCTALISSADSRMYRQKTQRKLGRLAEPRAEDSNLGEPTLEQLSAPRLILRDAA